MMFFKLILSALVIQCVICEKCLLHVCFKLDGIDMNCYDAFGNIFADDYTCIQGNNYGISTNCKDKIKIGGGCSGQTTGSFGEIIDIDGTKMVAYLIQQNYVAHMQKNNGTMCSLCYQVSFGTSCSSLIGGSFTITAGTCHKDVNGQFWTTDCENFVISDSKECFGKKEKIVQEINKCYYGSSAAGSGSQVITLNTCDYSVNGDNKFNKSLILMMVIIVIILSFLLY